MTSPSNGNFKRKYQTHLKHLRLKGLQPKTIEAYARAIRRIGAYFDHQIDDLSEQQLIDYFTVYSLGLRLGEGLRLQVGDVDAQRGRVHIRDANGNIIVCHLFSYLFA
jgi:integrase